MQAVGCISGYGQLNDFYMKKLFYCGCHICRCYYIEPRMQLCRS